MNVLEHVVYNLRNTPIRQHPYAHFFCENVFPANFYEDFLDSLPNDDGYSTGPNNYHGRRFSDSTVNPLLSFMNSQQFLKNIAQIFLPQLQAHFPDGKAAISHDIRLVRDRELYEIGPHTDARWKLVSLLFYLPLDRSLERLGTSIFVPKDPSFTCKGGPHYPFDLFDKVYTAPFIPNSCFGFFRTDNSFHGVEPIRMECERNVLLYNLYDSSKPRVKDGKPTS